MGYRVAVVGATGNVGREMLNILAERQFPLDELAAVASPRSTGDIIDFGDSGQELKVKNAELSDNRRMQFRIGINLGDVIIEGERLYGNGVNIAARLESLAIPGGICISGTVYDHVENKLALYYRLYLK